MALLMTGQYPRQASFGTQLASQILQPAQHMAAVIDRARMLAAPQARLLGQPRHIGHAMTFRLDALSRGAALQDVQRMGQYAKDRLNAS